MATRAHGATVMGLPIHSLPRMTSAKETLHRQWLMLQWIPRHPLRITARELVDRLQAGLGADIDEKLFDALNLSALCFGQEMRRS